MLVVLSILLSKMGVRIIGGEWKIIQMLTITGESGIFVEGGWFENIGGKVVFLISGFFVIFN